MSENEDLTVDELYNENQRKIMEEMPSDPNMKNFQMPSVEKILEMLEGMNDLSPEEKQQIRDDILHPKPPGADGGFPGQQQQQQQQPLYSPSMNDYFVFLAMIALITFVFVFFGYRLFQSVVQKQKKREEKLKAKQSKKKK